jgi:hypothetical protein
MDDKDEDILAKRIRAMMLDIMTVAYCNGFREVPVGAAMRLMGIDNDTAARHDDERIDIPEDFAETARQLDPRHRYSQAVPRGSTLH